MNPTPPRRLLLALLLSAGAALHAQILVDRSAPGHQRPTVLGAANGVPLVNIQTPSASGVSFNRYSQFDIGPGGVVLNNGSSASNTQLAGWVPGNPWLGNAPARVIVNQVNSQNPSYLNGPIEVAGQRAEVVVANPAGLSVNGGRFINAQGVTLVTGTPVITDGALEAFRVTGGSVSIGELGLDLSSADHARILARAMAVNGGLWANRLTVVTGSNAVRALASGDAATAQALAATGAAPDFLLDVAAIGGMYARHIYLRGTEAGLGVNNRGALNAQGRLQLRADGQLVNTGTVLGGDTVDIDTARVDNRGQVLGGAVAIRTGVLDNGEGAVIAARGPLTIDAQERISNRRGALLLSGGDMALTTGRLENRSARIEALGDLDVRAGSLLNANDHLQTEVIEGEGVGRTLYFTPAGEVDAQAVAWMAVKPYGLSGGDDYTRQGRAWILRKGSAWADPVYSTWYHGPEPFEAAGWVSVGSGDSEGQVWQDARFAYTRDDPIWAALDVTPPAGGPPGPMPRPPQGSDTPWNQTVDPKALAEWQAQAAPWVALGEKLAALRAAINSELLPFDIQQTVVERRPALRTLHSEPGQILAGGQMRLDVGGPLLNQDSAIVAGGALRLPGVSVDNRATEVSARITRLGTALTWGVVDHTCNAIECDTEFGWVATPVDQSLPTTLKAPVGRVAQAAPDAPTALPIDLGSALFAPVADSAAGHLYETDPRFTDRRQWLDAGLQLALLGLDAHALAPRLGDGFIEQRLVGEQIGTRTGQRRLDGFDDDEAQYRALLEAGATFAQAHELRPGIALSAGQVAALTSDIVWLEAQTVTLPDGRTATALVPRVYLRPRAGDLSPEGALLAGQTVQLDLSGELVNGGTVAGRDLVLIDAQGVRSSGRIGSQGITAVRTMQDIAVDGGALTARDALVVEAGRDLQVSSTTSASADGQVALRDRVARLQVTGEAGVLLAQAGRDLALNAAAVQGDRVGLQAGRDLSLGTVDTHENLDATRDERNYGRVARSAEAGTVVGGKTVALSAGRDANLRAAQVQADGDLQVDAGRDLNIAAGEARYEVAHGLHASDGDFMGATSTETRRLDAHTQAQGSALGGRQVSLNAGRDVRVQGSDVVADENLQVGAGRDVRVTSQATTERHERFNEETTHGVFGGNAGVTLGSEQQSREQRSNGTGAAGSTLGAIAGNVDIRAGGAYEQSGSDVLTGAGDIDVRARSIAITDTTTTEQRWQQDKARQGGISIGVSGAVVEAMQGVADSVEGIGKTDDRRMQALGVATAGLQTAQAVSAASQAAGGGASGISLNISIGGSSSQSTTEGSAQTAQASRVSAGGRVNLIASGAGADSDIVVRGSDIRAGTTARLKADGDVELRAAENTVHERTDSRNQSASVGVGFALGGGGAGFGITASASAGKGHAEGEMLTHRNSHVEAGQQVVIESGGDTTLAGAVVSAERVQADIGGDLRIDSPQDHLRYRERSQQAGGSVSFGAGAVTGGSLSASGTRIDSDYASVGEQSGLRAGNGGFDVHVKGKTTLNGGAITSTQAAVEAGRNRFESEGGAELQDVQNTARFKAEGWGVSAGVSVEDQKHRDGTPVVGPDGQPLKEVKRPGGVGWGSDQGEARSTTQAAISGIAGNPQARTGDAESGIAPIFDKNKVRTEVQAQVAITQNAMPVLAKGWGDLADQQRDQKKQQAAQLDANDPARARLLAEAEQWDEGGAYRAAGHAVIAGIAGGAGAAAGAGAASLTAPALNDLQDQMQRALESAGMDANVAKGISGLGVAAGVGLTAGVTGGMATGGAAFGADLNNRQLHPSETQWIKDNARRYAAQQGISEEEAQRRLAQQAYRQVQFGVEGEWDASASAFLSQAKGMLPSSGNSGPGYMFYATPDQKAAMQMYADSLPALADFYIDNGLKLPGAQAIAAGLARDDRQREVLTNLTLGAGAGASLIALAGTSPALLTWALVNPDKAVQLGLITADTAAGIASGAITPASLTESLGQQLGRTLSASEKAAAQELSATLKAVAQQKAALQQERRMGELVDLFDKQQADNSVTLAGTRYAATTNPAGTTKTFDTSGLTDAQLETQVFGYAKELAGGAPVQPVMRNGVPLEGRWSATLADGTTINVRSVSSSNVSRWTVDVLGPLARRNELPKYELKFQ
ncbi:hemagglutinin repeat-containing protein [Hydrogenophaga sp. T2]|uniref:hemagglutinin repeat-containing protein n=1 Tax=Hydrogenophaga sp. T2 TaxID=3132823 RepID=UPI003CEE533C